MRPFTAKVTPPANETAQDAPGGPAGPPPRGRPGVLVVDDDHLVRIMVQLGLERNGFEVWMAATGAEAIQEYQARPERIGVVLLDVQMPGLDGPATLEALRKINPEVRVCFMSGGMGKYDPEGLRQRGAMYVLAKPFQMSELANVLWLLAHGVPAELLPPGGACHS